MIPVYLKQQLEEPTEKSPEDFHMYTDSLKNSDNIMVVSDNIDKFVMSYEENQNNNMESSNDSKFE